MGLPDSYLLKPGSVAEYFDAIVNAQPPDRFSARFLEGLGLKSKNDRLLIGVLKDLGFLNADGQPTPRYYEYLDRSQSQRVLADAVREAFSDLFAVRTNANELGAAEVKDKLRTLYAGKKTDQVINRVAATFVALCENADFSSAPISTPVASAPPTEAPTKAPTEHDTQSRQRQASVMGALEFRSLQYHVNIVLPESRDQGVYDAIFKSLREHLG